MSIPEDVIQSLEHQGIGIGTYSWHPITNTSKFVAKRLTESSRDIPSFPLEVNIILDNLLATRHTLGTDISKVSINDLIIKASALALIEVPQVNSSFTSSGIAQHHRADIAVAVSTGHGLITPIVRDADTKPTSQISSELRDLIQRAHARKLQPPEYLGGTFTISNLGMFGISRFASIINPPHAAILSVGVGEKRLVIEQNDPTIRTVATMVLTCDHRVIDGTTGAKWLSAFRRHLESPTDLFKQE